VLLLLVLSLLSFSYRVFVIYLILSTNTLMPSITSKRLVLKGSISTCNINLYISIVIMFN
jgi:hypothetical protein